MVDPTKSGGPLRPDAPARTGAPRAEGARGMEAGGGAAFQALLEKLQTQADQLGRDAERVERPADLTGAVERAESSLRDALALQEQLLEAYRQALGR